MYKKVIHTQPKFPQMSAECQSIIEALLHREPQQRLGAVDNGADIAGHDFFTGMAWEDLLAKRVRPPFKSKSAAADDTQNFHRAFTNQKAVDSLTNPTVLSTEQEAHFEGFTYVPQPAGLAAAASDEPGALSSGGGAAQQPSVPQAAVATDGADAAAGVAAMALNSGATGSGAGATADATPALS